MERKFGKLFSSLIKMSLLLVVVMLIALPSSALAGAPKIKAMTRNLYLGADIFKVVDAATNPPLIPIDPDDPLCEDPESEDCPKMPDPYAIPYAVADVYQTMLYTNFWERAEALADEIALYEPDVVGLQEVSTYEKTTPSDLVMAQSGIPPEFWPLYQSTETVINFYSVLEAALQARGMEYTDFTVENADIEMPMVDAPPFYFSDIRLVDHDMILVRKDHDVLEEVLNANYQAQLELDLGGTMVSFDRGYLAVDVDVRGDVYRFVNTHLEVRSAPESVFRYFQSLQMQELVGTLAYLSSLDPKPIVMVGDFNSSMEDEEGVFDPDGDLGPHPGFPYEPPYMQAVSAGYKDAWTVEGEDNGGFTSGFDEYVSDPKAKLTSRIDLIFMDFNPAKVKAIVVGNHKKDMTPSGLWPSDHAGVVANIQFEK